VTGLEADRLLDVLKRAAHRGATAADGFWVAERRLAATVRLDEVETLTYAEDQRLALRVFVGRAAATASTSDLSPEALERVVEEATALARVTAEDPCAGLPDPGELAGEVPDLDLHDPGAHDLEVSEKIALARQAERAALQMDPRITNSEGARWWDREAHYTYATSSGFVAGYATSLFGLSVTPVASHHGEMQRDSWYSLGRKRARLDSPQAVGRVAAERALRRLGARKVRTTVVPVVFDPETAASLVRALAAAASGPSLYRRASFLCDRLGSRIASPLVTVVDDGRLVQGVGSRPFDGEGLPTRRVVVVDRGVLTSYLLDTYSGRKLGLPSTHHAVRDRAGVTVGTTNLMLLPGTATPEELIAEVREGLYVTELMGFGVNGVTGDYSRGAAGLWIEHGRLAYPVAEVTIAGNLLEMFAAVDGVGNDLVLRDRTAAPTLRVARMVVAGT
jgi:PmbA protein